LTGNTDDGPSFSWDAKWFSMTKDYGNYWIAEIAIPLKSIRYNAENKNWGVNFVRIDAKNFEYSTWTRIGVCCFDGLVTKMILDNFSNYW
jgi:hypothetical protein